MRITYDFDASEQDIYTIVVANLNVNATVSNIVSDDTNLIVSFDTTPT